MEKKASLTPVRRIVNTGGYGPCAPPYRREAVTVHLSKVPFPRTIQGDMLLAGEGLPIEVTGLGAVCLLFQACHLHLESGALFCCLVSLSQVELALLLDTCAGIARQNLQWGPGRFQVFSEIDKMQQFCLTALNMIMLLPDSVMACKRAPCSCVSQGPRGDGIIKYGSECKAFVS